MTMTDGILFKVGRARRVQGAPLYALDDDGELSKIDEVRRSILPNGGLVVLFAGATIGTPLKRLRVGTLEDWQRVAVHECGLTACGIPFKCAHCERLCGACIGMLDEIELKHGPICNDCAEPLIEAEEVAKLEALAAKGAIRRANG